MDLRELDELAGVAREEAKRLRGLHKSWADVKAGQFEKIAEVLRKVRQDQSMTGINGRRIE